MVLRTFGWSFAVTVVGLIGGAIYGAGNGQGAVRAFVVIAVLIVLEISLSFDNAVVNAKILERMSAFWQKMFLTVGILIAVFGMRLVFPLLLVGITASLGPVEAVELALDGGSAEEPGTYAFLLDEAYPTIAAFGGMFLMMLFLQFVFSEREVLWLSWLERPLQRLGALEAVSVLVAGGALVAAAEAFATDVGTVMVSGVLGIVAYLLVNGLGELFEDESISSHVDHAVDPSGSGPPPDGSANGGPPGPTGPAKATGKAAFFLFLYLEMIDASFSFDGVIGSFAITQDIIIIAIGLGVGAMYIRSLTVLLVRKGTLQDYIYLEHGAMWAIGALATILLVSLEVDIDEVVTGLIGVGFIGAAFVSSVIHNRRNGGPPSEGEAEREPVPVQR